MPADSTAIVAAPTLHANPPTSVGEATGAGSGSDSWRASGPAQVLTGGWMVYPWEAVPDSPETGATSRQYWPPSRRIKP